ncbi:MAG TPA: serine/threonine-protein kinase [Planctomycetaceae bacterium]|nr:serine/threonine-protein kinase [Planctomycetaceae bacterium]
MNDPQRAPGPPSTVLGATPPERVGSVIGCYKLLQQIGEGGFGVVYMAEQEQPVRRVVALKIIKPGMDTAQVIARFESERQALALMDHPNSARVLDAGATASGHPYFVMELVKGVPITEFCDKDHLAPQARLELFLDVCHAIQHAHHKGIIHRDIKPSNVMVTLHDGLPVVKVIDFGVAKATVQKLTERTLFTAYGQMVGTPAYMSPEQAEMSGLDIDTRSDVYSLGVLLYELLTGTTPLEAERLRVAAYTEMQRLIREEDAPRPSTRLSSLGDSATVVAGNRGLDVKRLVQVLSGDLDWVVMKALEKDRNRRYSTPGNFAEDIERYLRDEAILARPPSRAYRLKKFAQRNRGAVLTAAVVASALLAGTAVSTWQALRATRAERAALVAADSEKEAKVDAQAREAETKAVLGFVEDRIFDAARPEGQSGGLGREVTLRKAIDSALPFVEQSFPNQPLIEARLRLTLGRSFFFLGEPQRAAEQQEAARALYTRYRSRDDPETLTAMHHLATSYAVLGRLRDALMLREETQALRRTKLGSDHPDTLASMNNLGVSYAAVGRHAEALKLQEETLALRRTKLGSDHPDTLATMNNLAESYDALGRRAEALKLREQVLAIRRAKLGPDHPDTLSSMNDLAASYDAASRLQDALRLTEETLLHRKAKLGADHPDTLMSMNDLAVSYCEMGRLDEALKLNEETLARYKATLGADHPFTLLSMASLGESQYALGLLGEALKLREETLAIRKVKLATNHPDTLRSMFNVAESLYSVGRLSEAVKLNEETLAIQTTTLGRTHPDTIATVSNLAICDEALGRHADALKLREQTLAQRKTDLGPAHLDTLVSQYFLADSFYALGRLSEAVKLDEETFALQKTKLGSDHPDTLRTASALARGYDALGRHVEALKLGEETLALQKTKLGPDHPCTLRTMNNLVHTHDALGRYADALAISEHTLALRKSKLGLDHPDTLLSMRSVAECLVAVDRGAEAVPVIDECVRLAAGKDLDPALLPRAVEVRLRHFEKTKDVARCRQTAEMWEKLNRTDSDSLYRAACFRAVTAAVLHAADKSTSTAHQADAEANRAMDWLKQAAAAGFKDAAHIKQDKDLNALRARPDFQQLVAKLQGAKRQEKAKP